MPSNNISELSLNYNNIDSTKPDLDWAQGLGTLFALSSSAALGKMGSNIFKGLNLMEGVSLNSGQSLAGTGVGLLSNWTGRGITSAMGNSRLGRGIGAGTATALGSIGGQAVSNLFSNGSLLTHFANGGSGFFGKGAGVMNPYALGATVLGTALGAAIGPSKEYGGTYGNITRTMDSIYDTAMAGANFIPGIGQGISGAMALNKGLSNIFGSTDGMTKTDAILGSAFMLAPVKWLNMAGAKTTDTFKNLSWLNTEKADTFMGNAFGDLNDKFARARAESGKTYGMFSHKAYTKARDNINFANDAWNKVLAMADLNELLKIRSLYMSSINNLRYAQMVNGGFRPLAVGKQGMKIFNNATNHNVGLRLLSAAALIDNKAMILSAQSGTKITRLRSKPLPKKPATREENPELWDEWEKRETEQQATRLRVYDLEQQTAAQRSETNARYALHYSNLATGVAETAQQNAQFEPVNQESLQNSNTEQLRLEQLVDKDEYFDNGMKFINAAGFADLGVNIVRPLLLRGFRYAFNKARLLVKVPKTQTIELFPEGLINDKPLIAAGKNNDITDNLLKFLGIDDPNIVKNNNLNSLSNYNSNNFFGNEREMFEQWLKAGVDLSRIPYGALYKAIELRKQAIKNSLMLEGINRYTLVDDISRDYADNKVYYLYDKINDKDVGRITLSSNSSDPDLHIGMVKNLTKDEQNMNKVRGVYERLLNSSINTAHSDGYLGVISGEELLSAPKTYHILLKFKNRRKIGNYGTHTNENVFSEQHPDFNPEELTELLLATLQEQSKVSSLLLLAKRSGKRLGLLENAPVYEITSPTFNTPTKAIAFDPTIIDNLGRMFVLLHNPNIYKALVPTVIGTGTAATILNK